MICHQNIVIYLELVFFFVAKKQTQIFPKILVVVKYILTVIPSRQNMVYMLAWSYSRCPRHISNLPPTAAFVN